MVSSKPPPKAAAPGRFRIPVSGSCAPVGAAVAAAVPVAATVTVPVTVVVVVTVVTGH